MREPLSRALLGAEMVLFALPTAFIFVVPLAVPAAFLLAPLALLGLVRTLLEGGPQTGQEVWAWTGVLLKGVLAICALVALLCLLRLSVAFLLRGRAGLAGRSWLLRRGILFGAPPVLLSSIPGLVQGYGIGPLASHALLAALLYGGFPLLVPAVHLAWEVRARRRSSKAETVRARPAS